VTAAAMIYSITANGVKVVRKDTTAAKKPDFKSNNSLEIKQMKDSQILIRILEEITQIKLKSTRKFRNLIRRKALINQLIKIGKINKIKVIKAKDTPSHLEAEPKFQTIDTTH
jgi:hypothetical protein